MRGPPLSLAIQPAIPQVAGSGFRGVVMPKMKTNSSAKKRFKVTGSGRVKRQKAFANHILTKKSQKTKRNLRQSTLVDPADEARIKRLLNI